jgi:LCP family protein required for cell wall assembly
MTSTATVRARRSRRRRHWVRWVVAVFLVLVAGGSGFFAARLWRVASTVANVANPVQLIQQQIGGPAPGTLAWKLQHGERVNILALGYGGAEDAGPYLTDTIMVISIDSASQRVFEISVPRDLYVRIDAWQDGRQYSAKINDAFSVPHDVRSFAPGPLKAQYQGKDGSGRLAEATVNRLTGLNFDRYAAIDFRAFRSIVDSLGGVEICLEQPLDDYQYQYVRSGNVITGIHFPSGCQQVNGEQALELARSRNAVQPEQATDYGRAKRQQSIVNAIRKKVSTSNLLTTLLPLLESLQNNYVSDMQLLDIQTLYDFGKKLPDSATLKFPITGQDLVHNYPVNSRGSCGPPDAWVSCPEDPTYRMWHAIFDNLFVSRPILDEKAAVQLVNASNSADLHTRLTPLLGNLGFQMSGGVRGKPSEKTVVYDYSGGAFPRTATWLRDFFSAELVTVSPGSPKSGPMAVQGQKNEGLVVMLGADAGKRWHGEA